MSMVVKKNQIHDQNNWKANFVMDEVIAKKVRYTEIQQ